MNTKKFALVAAGLCATMFFAACDSTEKQNTAAGAMGEKSACCTDAKKCDTKCTGDAKTCTKGDECCMKKAAATTPAVAPGAVGDKKEGGCCATTKTSVKTESCCPAMKDGAKCPVTGTTNG
ncbi:MAG: hypothetical protein NT059_10485 [Planctomycetota bacterium]|nr:hypothetical protein [Planctomycetota bacterium]